VCAAVTYDIYCQLAAIICYSGYIVNGPAGVYGLELICTELAITNSTRHLGPGSPHLPPKVGGLNGGVFSRDVNVMTENAGMARATAGLQHHQAQTSGGWRPSGVL
jgi:hypothetical protein